MRLIEDLLPKTYQKDLYDLFVSNEFPWFYESGTCYSRNMSLEQAFDNHICIDKNTRDNPQFVHIFANNGNVNSNLFTVVRPILYFLEQQGVPCNSLRRIKANMIVQNADFPENHYNIAHVDSPRGECHKDIKSMIYYVNDSDGDTYFFNERLLFPQMPTPTELTLDKTVSPKAGSAVLFNAYQYHASSPPRNTTNRIVINFLFE